MPLHDWYDLSGWEGVHTLWMVDLLRWIKPRLPEGYRAYIGAAPVLAIGCTAENPDIQVRQEPSDSPANPPPGPEIDQLEPDQQIAVASLDAGTSLYVEQNRRLVAAIELISPRNKDRLAAQSGYGARYAGYLIEGVHLLLVDVHPRPRHFSFADQIAIELEMVQPALPTPLAVSYLVGGPAPTGGRFLGIWRRRLTPGEPLPTMRLPLTVDLSIPVALEETYNRAAADAYL
jgi:Protein of unknown function (DUF4058)